MSEPLALVIEDDFDASVIFSKALEAAGCKAESIQKGDIALKRLHEIVPALIVLDLHLPNVVGSEILEYIRGDARLEKTIVMLATADSRMADVVRDQADLVLLKPVTFTQVRDFAMRLLRRVEIEAAEAPPKAEAVTTSVTEVAAIPSKPEAVNASVSEATSTPPKTEAAPVAVTEEAPSSPAETPSAPASVPAPTSAPSSEAKSAPTPESNSR